MKIADAVRRAIAEGHDQWKMFLPMPEAKLHIRNAQTPARRDAIEMRVNERFRKEGFTAIERVEMMIEEAA